MSKINTKKDLGIRAEEALVLLKDSLKKEGFDEEIVRDFHELVVNGIKGKVTIHEKDIFEEKLIELIKEYKEQLKKKDYRSSYKQLLWLFQDETKSKIRKFLESRRSDVFMFVIAFIAVKMVFVAINVGWGYDI